MDDIIGDRTSLLEHNGDVPRFEIVPHTADVAVAVYGDTVDDLFANAGATLFELMFDMTQPASERTIRVEATGEGLDELLVAWLSELLVTAEIEAVALSDFDVAVLGERWAIGSAAATPLDELVLIGTPIKAVTYHDLSVRRAGGEWVTTIVFDV